MADKTVFEIDGDESDYSDSDSGSENSDKKKDETNNFSDSESENSEYYSDSDFEGKGIDDEGSDPDADPDYQDRIKVADDSEDEDEDEDEEDEEKEEDENYLQKFKQSLKTNVITEHHPELIVHNFEEVDALCTIVRDADGLINDPLHRTLPFITKYEKAKILGERAKQINAGAEAFVEVEEEIIDGYLIALAEFEQKMIPMIVRRPLPNGGSEYWRLSDLEIL